MVPGYWLQYASLGKPLRAAPWFFVSSVLNACGRTTRTDLAPVPQKGHAANAIALLDPSAAGCYAVSVAPILRHRAALENERMATGATDFDIPTLRARRTNKWHKFPDDVLPAWVADMDFGVAPSIAAAMSRLTQNQEYGYAAREGVLAAAFVRRMERRFGWRTDPADA